MFSLAVNLNLEFDENAAQVLEWDPAKTTKKKTMSPCSGEQGSHDYNISQVMQQSLLITGQRAFIGHNIHFLVSNDLRNEGNVKYLSTR